MHLKMCIKFFIYNSKVNTLTISEIITVVKIFLKSNLKNHVIYIWHEDMRISIDTGIESLTISV